MSSTVEKQGDKRAALSSDRACKRRKKNAPAMDYEITNSSPTSEAASVPSEPEHIPPPERQATHTFKEILSLDALNFLIKFTFQKFKSYFDEAEISEDGEVVV
jgi:hypothetical protein